MEKVNFVRKLKEVGSNDLMIAGGKGANLGEMMHADLPVPNGFIVLTSAYYQFVQDNQLQPKIKKLLQNIDSENHHDMSTIQAISDVSKEIANLFEKNSLSSSLTQSIMSAYSELGHPPVAVRSSATAEDLPGMSFAGQYESFLNIQGEEALIRSIRKCWASLWNDRALTYRIKQGISNEDIAHGIVVQQMIIAEKSGILFTANPLNGRRDQMLLNASWGIGEAIVSGEVTPDQWVMDKKSNQILEENIAHKKTMTLQTPHGVELVKTPEDKQKQSSLDRDEVLHLLDLGKKVEQYFGSPQDIEWSYKDGYFYLVQTRPVTSLYPMPKSVSGKEGLRVFLNMNNYSQAMKEPFTPMGESVIKAMVEGMVVKMGKKTKQKPDMWWYQELGGRVFIDITDFMRTEKSWNKFKMSDDTDKDPMTTKALLQLVQRNKEEIINPRKAVSFLSVVNFRMLSLLVKIARQYMCGIFSPVKAREKAIQLGESIIGRIHEELKNLHSMEDQLNYIEKNAYKIFLDGFGIVFYVAVSSGYIAKAKKILEKYGLDTSDLNLVEQSVPYSVTTEMGMEILQLAKTYHESNQKPDPKDEAVQSFINKYGHRSLIELDVGATTWKEDPSYVLDLIQSSMDPAIYQKGINKFNQGKVEAEEAISRITEKLVEKGKKRAAKNVEKMLKSFREMFGIREYPKFFTRKFLSLYRDILIELGKKLTQDGRIQKPLDVFYLTMEDVRSNQDLISIAQHNHETFQRNLKLRAPRLLTSTGESVYSPKEDSSPNLLTGVAVSPGTYEGYVKILASPDEGIRLEKGDILVTVGTNPAWTPLFLTLGGLIMETGGPISHGSVVAREYGLPAVAGVPDVTTRLKEGQKVRINGETGQVEILTEEAI